MAEDDPINETGPTSTPSPDANLGGERDPAAMEAVREAARRLLDATFASFREERVLPRPRFAPWIRMARDYYGDMVRGGADLDAALKRGWPERFNVPVGNPMLEFASTYERALIEDGVQAATRAEQPYASASPAVAEAIERMIARFANPPRLKVANVIADVATADDATVVVGDIQLTSVPNGAERLLESEIPGAGFLLDREDAIALGGGGTSLAVTEESDNGSFEDVSARARERLRRLVTAIRLGTGSTARPMADVAGEPGTCHLIGPIAYPLRHAGRLSFVHRSAMVGANDVAWIEALTEVLVASGLSPLPSTMVAVGRLNRVLDEPGRNLADQAVDLATGLEAALAGRRAESEIGLRLRNRAAAFLSSPDDPPSAIYGDVKLLYGLRSAFVHGSSMSMSDVWKLVGRVSSARGTDWRGEQYELALDRWRDVLRRAILFRLAVGSPPDPRWPLVKDNTDVDAVIVDSAVTDRWRMHVLGFWADRGLPRALQRAPALQGLISIAQTDSAPGEPPRSTV